MQIPYLIVSGGVNMTIEGEPYSIHDSHPHYAEIIDLLRKRDFEGIPALIDVGGTIKKYVKGAVEISNDTLFYKGMELHSSLAEHIIKMFNSGYPVDPLIRFLENLMRNPSSSSVGQFFRFVERNKLTIDDEGFVIMYKGVRDDLTDCHTGTFDNSPGSILEMPRNGVDDDRDAACSYGFHAGSWEYVKSFGSVKLVVRVDPADVVSVPKDSNCTKVRVCRYEVLERLGQFYHNTPVAADLAEWQVTVGIRHESSPDAYLMIDHQVRAGTAEQAQEAALTKTKNMFKNMTTNLKSGRFDTETLPDGFRWNKNGRKRGLKRIRITEKTEYRIMSSNRLFVNPAEGQSYLVEYLDGGGDLYHKVFRGVSPLGFKTGKDRAAEMACGNLENIFGNKDEVHIVNHGWRTVGGSSSMATCHKPDATGSRFRSHLTVILCD